MVYGDATFAGYTCIWYVVSPETTVVEVFILRTLGGNWDRVHAEENIRSLDDRINNRNSNIIMITFDNHDSDTQNEIVDL